MEPATISMQNGVPCLSLHGRIDATVTDQLAETANELLAQAQGSEIIIDCGDLSYISSAGLRQILSIKKKKPDTRVINCSNEIYSVFDMTGFTQMMDISKAYRSMSVEGCDIVGRGAKGTVYRVDPETVLKVFHDPNALPSIQREQTLAKEAFVLGIPTAIAYDIVKVKDHFGSLFELLDCDSMAHHLNDPDGVSKNGEIFADLLRLIHGTDVSDRLRAISLPSEKQNALKRIDCLNSILPEATFTKTKALLDQLPEPQKLLHGDLHAKNVMLQNGEAILIDMDTLCYGDPILELAYIFNAYAGHYLLHPEEITGFMNISPETGQEFWKTILRLYCRSEDPEKLQAVENRAALIGYTRLLSRLVRHDLLEEGDNRQLADLYIEKIKELAGVLENLSLASALG